MCAIAFFARNVNFFNRRARSPLSFFFVGAAAMCAALRRRVRIAGKRSAKQSAIFFVQRVIWFGRRKADA